MQTNRSSILLLIAVILSLCVFIVAAGLWMWNFTVTQRAQQPTDLPASTDAPGPTEQAGATTATQPTSTPSVQGDPGDLPAGVLADMETIQSQVIGIRGLEPAGPFSRAILSREELAERVRTDFFTDYTPEDAAQDARILALLGLLEPDYDLIGLFTELYSEQILGFYDDETQGDGRGGQRRIPQAGKNHLCPRIRPRPAGREFRFPGRAAVQRQILRDRHGTLRAIQALIEGEATLIEL
jgi:hypothetical protein